MQLKPGEIHVWSANLAHQANEQEKLSTLLSADEIKRANRFHFPIHQRRFIAARAILRQILALYLNINPEMISFAYSQYKKPYLSNKAHAYIQFNLAHSHDLAIYAVTLNHAIGIDIEKIQHRFNKGIASRYFAAEENKMLSHLPPDERVKAFYTIWSRKEAIIKAQGKGLSIPLSSFIVSIQHHSETVQLENETWYLTSLSIHPDFEAALATNQKISHITYHFFK